MSGFKSAMGGKGGPRVRPKPVLHYDYGEPEACGGTFGVTILNQNSKVSR
jgi:hypothetical protein